MPADILTFIALPSDCFSRGFMNKLSTIDFLAFMLYCYPLGFVIQGRFMQPAKRIVISPELGETRGYEVSFEPLTDHLKERFSKVSFQKYLALFEKIQKSPKECILELEIFFKEQPNIPEIANLLCFAYLQANRMTDAEKLIEETYLTHPDYLFGRINFADQCLRRKELAKVPVIFNNTFSLGALYPEKKAFHFSEYRGFMVVIGFYHLAINEKEKACGFYEKAMRIDPLHSSVIALEKAISRTNFLKKIRKYWQKLAHIFLNP